ncbi:hypothetical protein [Photobacterium profundum]|uniref:hypothetical protein n=1 Tax=Photobacterium profundum TaxID=74109 RepID=UPI00030C0179|nr:hypothetical protein [Photobacterium profundum]
MHPDKPLKALFNRQQEWLTFLNKHIGHVREAVIENVTKMGSVANGKFGRFSIS